MPSLYVHFPWCLAKCPYCDFVSYAAERTSIDHEGYADAILREAAHRATSFRGEVRSIFFGGGTPSLWEPRALARVLGGLRELFRITPGAEITAECNPTSLDAERARALHEAGVERLSIGTQSLRKEQLSFLGRLHDPDGARRAIEGALAAGVPRVSTDLIFGLPGQSPEDAATQATELAGLGLRHLSCYQLTIEPGTLFGERKKRGLLPMADEGVVAESFLAIDEALAARGLRHYEISNYAAPGEEARHNLGYWRGEEYVGLGCGAYGFVREDDRAAGGRRYRNPIDPRGYVAWTRAEMRDVESEPLAPEALLRERIMLGLRLAGGLDLAAAGDDLGLDPWTADRTREVERLVSNARLVREGDVLRIPRDAWLFTDDTASRLF